METTSGVQSSTTSIHTSTPNTPPHTPNHHRKRRLSNHNNVSPASSLRSAIRPSATSSPAPRKKVPKRHSVVAAEDSVKVEELTDVDAGYIPNIEVVYPHELEEVESLNGVSLWRGSDTDAHNNEHDGATTGRLSSSPSSDNEESPSHSDNDARDSVTEQFSRLGCTEDDEAEAAFEAKRREKHIRRRAESRVFKRPHSLTINTNNDDADGLEDVADEEAMADHDLPMSARRLRRRVQGPDEGWDMPMSPADSGTRSPIGVERFWRGSGFEDHVHAAAEAEEEMDVDVDDSE